MSNVEAYHHSTDSRSRIPSQEEAGSEAENPVVVGQKKLEIMFRNPISHRGQDPELFWKDKYGSDDQQETLEVDSRSLYRYEHISPETLMSRLYRAETTQPAQLGLFTTFGNDIEIDELEKVSEYYRHQDGWTNRLIQGDSKLVMASLLTRENMAGKVQSIYFDPPYGIKYNSNWQQKLNSRDVTDGKDESITSEPEQIKAFRDTWLDGIHSYLTYMRDRLLVARELLTNSGSCFVQISDENVHLIRTLMDEVFGSENFVSLITFAKTTGFAGTTLSSISDYVVWYAKDVEQVKYHQLYKDKQVGDEGATKYRPLNTYGNVSAEVVAHLGEKHLATLADLTSQGASLLSEQTFEFRNKLYNPPKGLHWKTTVSGGFVAWLLICQRGSKFRTV